MASAARRAPSWRRTWPRSSPPAGGRGFAGSVGGAAGAARLGALTGLAIEGCSYLVVVARLIPAPAGNGRPSSTTASSMSAQPSGASILAVDTDPPMVLTHVPRDVSAQSTPARPRAGFLIRIRGISAQSTPARPRAGFLIRIRGISAQSTPARPRAGFLIRILAGAVRTPARGGEPGARGPRGCRSRRRLVGLRFQVSARAAGV